MVTLALTSFVRGRSRYRRSDLMEVIQACGAAARHRLFNQLSGRLILAYMGAVQLPAVWSGIMSPTSSVSDGP